MFSGFSIESCTDYVWFVQKSLIVGVVHAFCRLEMQIIKNRIMPCVCFSNSTTMIGMLKIFVSSFMFLLLGAYALCNALWIWLYDKSTENRERHAATEATH